MSRFLSLLFLIALSLAGEPAKVTDRGLEVVSITGQTLKPFAIEQRKASVLFFVTHDCPISNRYAPEIKRICENFASKGVSCYLVYSDTGVNAEAISSHYREYRHGGYPAIHDQRHQLVKTTGATTTPEAVLVDSTGTIAYRGRIDNAYATWGQARGVVTETDLRDAITAVLAGLKPAAPRTKAVGCYIPALPLSH